MRRAAPARAVHAPVRFGHTRLRAAVGAATTLMVASAVALALTSDHLDRPGWTALYRGYLIAVPALAGLAWSTRRPGSRFGSMLVAFGVVAWVVSWQSADQRLLFDLGVVAEGPLLFLTFYLVLAFPTGRLERVAEKVLMAALAAVLLGFFVPSLLLTAQLGSEDPLSPCAPSCPGNVLEVYSSPAVFDVLSRAVTYVGLAVLLGILAVYVARLRVATRPQRRALAGVAATSLLLLPAFFAYYFSAWVLKLDSQTLGVLASILVGARLVFPLGFLLALVQADRFATAAERRLLEQLTDRPTPEEWRDDVARALDDPALRFGYWDPPARRYREPDGGELIRPAPGSGRLWVPIDRAGAPVAALVTGEALAEDPELLAVATAATLLAVEQGHLAGELRASRARTIAAGEAERRRIERDLHDSAQQRLVAVRIELSLTREQLQGTPEEAALRRLGEELDRALDELRSVAHGLQLPELERDGVAAALTAIAEGGTGAVTIRDHGLRRHRGEIELAIYLCCVEALQNAAKHAGDGARVEVELGERDGWIEFSVRDDGRGFDADAPDRGDGLINLADRLGAVGGTLWVESAPGRGTCVRGRTPG
jgi:signal transduction histidine kinase